MENEPFRVPQPKRLKSLQLHWNDLAVIDPMWAICSDPDRQHGLWDQGEFFRTGRLEIRNLMAKIETAGIRIAKKDALDFGCGIGRLTQALANEFDHVVGIDIAHNMLTQAKELNQAGTKVDYRANPGDDLSQFDDASFDFICSNQVLQHMPADLMVGYLRDFPRVLRPSGVLAFQVPTSIVIHNPKSDELRRLGKTHPKRLANAVLWRIWGDSGRRFYRARILPLSSKWLYSRFGLRPNIAMNYLKENVIADLMGESGMVRKHVRSEVIRNQTTVQSTEFVYQKSDSN